MSEINKSAVEPAFCVKCDFSQYSVVGNGIQNVIKMLFANYYVAEMRHKNLILI